MFGLTLIEEFVLLKNVMLLGTLSLTLLVALSSKYIILLTEAAVVGCVRFRYISCVNSEIRKLQLLVEV